MNLLHKGSLITAGLVGAIVLAVPARADAGPVTAGQQATYGTTSTTAEIAATTTDEPGTVWEPAAADPAARPRPCTTGQRIDVGYTVYDAKHHLVKGSGSYSNCSGGYAGVCVQLWQAIASSSGMTEIPRGKRCVKTPKGPGFAFSPPDQRCGAGHWFTVVTAYKPLNHEVAHKVSNVISLGRC